MSAHRPEDPGSVPESNTNKLLRKACKDIELFKAKIFDKKQFFISINLISANSLLEFNFWKIKMCINYDYFNYYLYFVGPKVKW